MWKWLLLNSAFTLRLGLEVTGIDASIKIIQLAKSNALRYQTSADFIRADFATFLRYVNTKFDSIFCLGNALAHLLNRNELDTAIDNFYQVLELDGYIIIQLLNYSKILKEKQRIVGITECENKIFIRFYDFHDTLIQFNILTVIRERGGFSHQWVVPHRILGASTISDLHSDHMDLKRFRFFLI